MAWFDCAVRRPIGTNTGGRISTHLGLILHHQAGNGSLYNFFNNPSAQVSAHFWVSKTGIIEQYVDTAVVAWHGRQLNSRYQGVETEGCPTSPWAEPLTEAALAALGRLYAEGMRRHAWAPTLANKDGEKGFGFHRMAVATGCPCDVRLNMRSEIIRRAQGGQPTPPPTNPIPFIGGNVPFLRSGGKVYWFIAAGRDSYWREVPAGLVNNIPTDWIMNDPNGDWLKLWRVGAGG